MWKQDPWFLFHYLTLSLLSFVKWTLSISSPHKQCRVWSNCMDMLTDHDLHWLQRLHANIIFPYSPNLKILAVVKGLQFIQWHIFLFFQSEDMWRIQWDYMWSFSPCLLRWRGRYCLLLPGICLLINSVFREILIKSLRDSVASVVLRHCYTNLVHILLLHKTKYMYCDGRLSSYVDDLMFTDLKKLRIPVFRFCFGCYICS